MLTDRLKQIDLFGVKKCIKCGIEKPMDNFFINKKSLNGRAGVCKPCKSKWMRKDRIDNPDRYREQDYKQNYGIDLVKYNEMVKSQNGVCAICGCAELRKRKFLHIDHNHSTKKVRGLLCGNCNYA